MHTEVILGISVAAFALLQSVVGWLIKSLMSRIKTCEDACAKLSNKFGVLQAQHDGTAKAIDELRKALDGWQREIREQLGKVHDRINEVAQK